LKAEIAMDKLGQVSAACDVSRRRVEMEDTEGGGTALAGKPFVSLDQEGLARGREGIALIDNLVAEWNVHQKEPTDYGS
jgi:hypothetical protein